MAEAARNSMVGTILGYLLFGVAGWVVLALLPGRGAFGRLERLGLAGALGVGAVAFQMLIYGLAGIAWRQATVAAPWLVGLAALAVLRWHGKLGSVRALRWADLRQWPRSGLVALRRAAGGRGRLGHALTTAEMALGGSIALAVGLAFAAAAIHVLGVQGGEDAFQQYFLKAKALYLYGRLGPVLSYHTLAWFANLDHPPLLPLSVLWIYIAGSRVNETAGLLLSPLLYLALLLVFYALVRHAASRRLALALTLLLAFAPTGPNLVLMGAFTPGYADMPLALYALCGAGYTALAIGEPERHKRTAYFAVGGMALGCAALTKNEGEAFLAAVALAAALLIARARGRRGALIRGFLLAGTLGAGLALPWVIARRVYDLSVVVIGHASTSRGVGAVAFALGSFAAHAALYWNVALVALAAGLILEWRGQRRLAAGYVGVLLAAQCALGALGPLATPLEIHYEVAATAGRFLLQATPLLFYLIHMTLANDRMLGALMVATPETAGTAPASPTPAPSAVSEVGGERVPDAPIPARSGAQLSGAPSSGNTDQPQAQPPAHGMTGESGGLAASVVLPTHGRRASLLRVLAALGRQHAPPGSFEVVVVCDGDVDGSAEACRALAPELPYELQVLTQPNAGPASARNRAVAAARADLIVFIDDDVVPDERWLATHLAAQAGQEAQVTIGPLLPPPDFRLNAWGAWEERALCQQYAAMQAGRYKATYRQFYTGNAAILKRHILDAGGFDAAFQRAEDVELALRLRDRGLRFHFLPEARGWHYVRRTFASWRRMATAYGAADVAMAEAGRPQVLILAAREYPHRNRLVRLLTPLCAGRTWAMGAVVTLLGALAWGADRAGMVALGNMACSLIFNLRYYDGIARALGGHAGLRRLLSGDYEAEALRRLVAVDQLHAAGAR
jgi:GT2 family glycosyltransferase